MNKRIYPLIGAVALVAATLSPAAPAATIGDAQAAQVAKWLLLLGGGKITLPPAKPKPAAKPGTTD